MAREHLAEIYIIGGRQDGNRARLTLLCSRCGGPEITADITVAAVHAAATAHIQRVDGAQEGGA